MALTVFGLSDSESTFELLRGSLLGEQVSRGSAVELDFDHTVLVQVVLFVVLYLVLKPTLFDPVLRLFKERERLTDETIEKAKAIDGQSVVAKDEYETAMQAARREANVERDRLRSEGVKEDASILAEVRAKTAHRLEQGRKLAEAELRSVRGQLDVGAKDLARDLAARVLGREVGS